MTEANFQVTPGLNFFSIDSNTTSNHQNFDLNFLKIISPGVTCLIIHLILQTNLLIAKNRISTQVSHFLKFHFLLYMKQKQQSKDKTKQKKSEEHLAQKTHKFLPLNLHFMECLNSKHFWLCCLNVVRSYFFPVLDKIVPNRQLSEFLNVHIQFFICIFLYTHKDELN